MKADIVFLVDSSGSVGSSNFVKTKDFVSKMIDKVDVGPDAMNVGVIRYF